ncbi:unnamed protein product, partial [Prorocentrum cordatum]
ASLLTLAQASVGQVPPDSVQCWRGLGLPDSGGSVVKERTKEFARYQDDCRRENGARHLRQVLRLRERAERRRADAARSKALPPEAELHPTDSESLPLFGRRRPVQAGTWSASGARELWEGLQSEREDADHPTAAGTPQAPGSPGQPSPVGVAVVGAAGRPVRRANSPRSPRSWQPDRWAKEQKAQADAARQRDQMSSRLAKRLGLAKLRLQSRLLDFRDLPATERERAQRAFYVGASEGEGGSKLNEGGLCVALADMGLRGASPKERAAVRLVVDAFVQQASGPGMMDFVLNVVPQVREALGTARSVQLTQIFTKHDSRHLDLLTQQQCLQALEMVLEDFAGDADSVEAEKSFWETFVCVVPDIVERTLKKLAVREVDLVAFRSIVSEMDQRRGEFHYEFERHEARVAGLDETLEARHFGEIGRLRRIFMDHRNPEDEEEPVLHVSRALAALTNSGVLPGVGQLPEATRSALRQKADGWRQGQALAIQLGRRRSSTSESEERISFHDFLTTIAEVRKAEATTSRRVLLRAMRGSALARDQPVPLESVVGLLVQAGLCVESCSTVGEVAAAVWDCNREGLDGFSVRKLLRLLARVLERTRSRARLREEVVRQRVGLSHHEVMELRGWWGRLTLNGVGVVPDVRKALEQLDPQTSPSDSEIERMILELQPPPESQPLPIAKRHTSADPQRPNLSLEALTLASREVQLETATARVVQREAQVLEEARVLEAADRHRVPHPDSDWDSSSSGFSDAEEHDRAEGGAEAEEGRCSSQASPATPGRQAVMRFEGFLLLVAGVMGLPRTEE